MNAQDNYYRRLLQKGVAKMCQNQGWTAITHSALDTLLDVLERNIMMIAKKTHAFTELYGRTQSNLDDLSLAFQSDKIDIGELLNFVQNADQTAFAQDRIAYPARKADSLQIPKPNSIEILHHREEHIHEHLPAMYPSLEDAGEQQDALPQASRDDGLENTPSNGIAPVTTGEKRPERPAPTQHDPLTPGKRSRVPASDLPEEAGHSQYEMSSAIMTPDGTILGLNGRGKMPDSGPPPPSVRFSSIEQDSSSSSSKKVEGSDANADIDTPSKDPAVHNISTATGKEGSTGGSGNKSKSESSKTKSKKKEKNGLDEKDRKQKKTDKESDKKVKITVSRKRPASIAVESGSTTPKKPKLKDGKTTEGSSKSATKVGRIKKKPEMKKKATPSLMGVPSSSMVNESGSESCLKDLLLSSEKLTPAIHSEQALSASSVAHKQDLMSTVSSDSDMLLRQAFPPTDIFDSESRETSPQRLIIAEAEGRAQEKEEEKRIRLQNIDETISAVIRDYATKVNSDKIGSQTMEKPVPPVNPAESPRKRGRPKKVKAKDKIKSSEFIAEDVIRQEKDEEMGARSMKSITDTIDAVIRQGSEEPRLPLPEHVDVEAISIPPVSNISAAPEQARAFSKESKKRKAEKDKSPVVKKKLKTKLQNKTEKDSESASSQIVDLKPFVSDKYSNAEMKVFEFGETDSPPPIPERRPSQAEKEPSPIELLLTPLVAPESYSPKDVKSDMKMPTPETIVPFSSFSPPGAPGSDQQLLSPLKIEIPREKERHKEKSRDKEHHRKDKKEKRRDKEKKKKNRDRDRDRDKERHDKHHHERRSKEETPPSGLKGLKLKIKLGTGDRKHTLLSTEVVKDIPSDAESVEEHPSPSQLKRPSSPHKGLKLVIRQDTAEGTNSQKKYSSVVSSPSKPVPSFPTPKSEPRNTPPTLHPASPQPGTPPIPVLSPVRERSLSPAPPTPGTPPSRPEAVRSDSPVPKSPLSHGQEEFHFTTPRSSPLRRRPSLSPPPPTPCFSPKSPSPMPKTPSPKPYCVTNSPVSFSSPFHGSPVGHKSPTPTPRTPSFSPAYHQGSPGQSQQDKSPGPVGRLFGTPEHDTAPSSPIVPAPCVDIKPVQTHLSPLPVTKVKGKVGRPRLKSPKTTSPKGKSPKSPRGVGRTPKAVKAGGIGKSTGRGRPPKAKTLALRAAQAALSSEVVSTDKPKPKALTPPSLDIKRELLEKTPAASSIGTEADKTGQDSSSESPSPTQLSMAFTSASSSKQRGTVETETVGSYIDADGVKVWFCPACKLQDDGSAMIGCDKCDDWYHWVCVNITEPPPEEESWFCPRCSAKTRKPMCKGKRGRKKKIH